MDPSSLAANTHELSEPAWQRMVTAVDKVHDRLLRTAAALEKAGVPYAVVGGNAVAAWVSEVDIAAVRNTQDVDIALRRQDLDDAAPQVRHVVTKRWLHELLHSRGGVAVPIIP